MIEGRRNKVERRGLGGKVLPAAASGQITDSHNGDDPGQLRHQFVHNSVVSIRFPAYQYPEVAMSTFGAIWPKRSCALAAPKSGEQEDQTAPRLVVASMPMTASGPFGRNAATRSPGPTPRRRRPAAARPVCSWSSR